MTMTIRTPRYYDAIVVGARVAGATTAHWLASAGLDVLLVDRASYGRGVLSTHAFMRGGVVQLARLGVVDDLIAAGTPPIRRTVIRYGGEEEVIEVRPSDHVDALYAPHRTVLDRILVDAAVRAGVDVRFRTTLTGLLRGADGEVLGAELQDAEGRSWTARAPITIGADGIHSRVAREVGAVTYARGSSASAMVVGYFAGVEADGYQWLYGNGCAGGVIPTNDGQVSVWAGLPRERFLAESRQRPGHGFHEILRQIAPDWSARLARGRQEGPLRGFAGVPGFLRQPWGRGWALVGDAGYFKDPLTTHGMTDALRDAELLARAVIEASEGRQAWDRALVAYHDTRDSLSHELFKVTDRVASFRWSMDELRPLLIEVSRAMRPTVEHVSSLASTPAHREVYQ
jgi:flavin-dependent dehydrogenase